MNVNAPRRIFQTLRIVGGLPTALMLCNNAELPRRGTDGSAGYDLSAMQECTIAAKGKGIVKTRLAISFPPGMSVRIAPRFGLAV